VEILNSSICAISLTLVEVMRGSNSGRTAGWVIPDLKRSGGDLLQCCVERTRSGFSTTFDSMETTGRSSTDVAKAARSHQV